MACSESHQVRQCDSDNDLMSTGLVQEPRPGMDPSSFKSTVPMDSATKQLYEEACSKGTKKVYRTRIMLVGHFGAGKTSVMRSLLHEDFVEEHKTTDGAERGHTLKLGINVRTCVVTAADTAVNWQKKNITSKEELAEELAPYLHRAESTSHDSDRGDTQTDIRHDAKSANIDRNSPAEQNPELIKHDEVGSNEDAEENTDSSRTIGLDKTDINIVTNETLDEMRTDVMNMTTTLSEGQQVTCNIWDFGGQHVYYASHQTFLSKRAVYLPVMDMSKSLDDVIEHVDMSTRPSTVRGRTMEKLRMEELIEELKHKLSRQLEEWHSKRETEVFQQRGGELYVKRSLKATGIKGDQLEQLEVPDILQLLEQSPRDARIVITADAGSGKTCLLRHITNTWLQGHGIPDDLVFHIPLGRSRCHDIPNIICRVMNLLPTECTESLSEVLNMSYKRVLFLLDSYEELPFETEELNKLIRGDIYPDSTVVVTTRPGSQLTAITQNMPARTEAQLQDFSEEEMSQYLQDYFADIQAGELPEIAEHFFGTSFLQRPIELAIACYLYNVHSTLGSTATTTELLTTQTALLSGILQQTMQAYVRKTRGIDVPLANGSPLENKDVPAETQTMLKEIGRMCFHAFRKNQQWLNTDDSTVVNTKDLLDFGLFTAGSEANTVTVPHSLFQEYLDSTTPVFMLAHNMAGVGDTALPTSERATDTHDRECNLCIEKIEGLEGLSEVALPAIGTLYPSVFSHTWLRCMAEAQSTQVRFEYESRPKDCYTRAMLVGDLMAGKNSVKRSLLREEFAEEHETTDGVETEDTCLLNVDTAVNWQTENTHMKEFILELDRQLHEAEHTSNGLETENVQRAVDSIATALHEGQGPISNIWEFGRRHTLHQAYLSNRAIYLLMMQTSMSQDDVLKNENLKEWKDSMAPKTARGKLGAISHIWKQRRPILPSNFTTGVIGYEGGTLQLGGMSLVVPPGALPGQKKIKLGIGWMSGQQGLHDNKAMLSPVVICEPQGLQFQKPVKLTTPHCATNEGVATLQETWEFIPIVQSPHSEQEGQQIWVEATLGDDFNVMTIKRKQISLELTRLNTFALLGERKDPDSEMPVSKVVKLIACAPPLKTDGFAITVHCVDQFQEELMECEIKKEGLVILGDWKPLIIQDTQGDLRVQLDPDVIDGQWEVTGELSKDLRFDDVWAGKNPSCSFELKHAGQSPEPLEIVCQVTGFQIGQEEQKAVFQIAEMGEIPTGEKCGDVQNLDDVGSAGPDIQIQPKSGIKLKFDVNSFGITVWEVLTREVAYPGTHVPNVAPPPLAESGKHPAGRVLDKFESIIRLMQMWGQKPEDRPSLSARASGRTVENRSLKEDPCVYDTWSAVHGRQ